jgi:hypothetical protein
MSATLQRRFHFDLYTVAVAPLVPLSGLRALMGADEDTVLAHIESGALPFAFDLAMPGARRAELRVWRGAMDKQAATLDQVIEDVLGPSPLPTLNVRTLRHRWVCSSTHIHHLIEAGCLTEVGGAQRKLTNTRNVSRTSAIAFLKERRKA